MRFLSAEDVASRYKLKVLTAARRSLIRRVTIRAVPRNSRGLFPRSPSRDSKSPELKLYISVETLVRPPPPSANLARDSLFRYRPSLISLVVPLHFAAALAGLLNALRAASILDECKTLPVTFTTNF